MTTEKFLLDTSICVSFLRGKHNASIHIKEAGLANCCISEITYLELLYGAYCSNDTANKITEVKDFCNKFDIIPISEAIELFAEQKTILKKEGTLIDDFDLLIGCTAMLYNMVLVTDNLRHLSRLPVRITNWLER